MKKLAPIAAMLGVSAALVLGGAATASATSGYSCSNGINNIVTCNNVVAGVPVVLRINGTRLLTAGEISVLDNNLNKTQLDVTALKTVVVGTYKSFNPTIIIAPKDVNVCIASKCS